MRRIPHLALILLLLPVAGHAARSDLLDARALAMGGALRALAGPVEAARLNPAALNMQRGFFAGTSYTTERELPYDAFSLTLVDNITSPMGGALQYLHVKGDEEREDFSLGLSLGKKGLWWGFTTRFIHARESDEAEWHDVFTGDLGFLFERPGGTRFTAVGYDLIDTTLGFVERRFAFGIAQNDLKGWNLEADLVRNLERDFSRGIDLHLGAEYAPSAAAWALRFGQMWRGDNGRDYPSAGVGWDASRIRLGYAVQWARQDASELYHAFSVDGSF